MRHYDVIEDNGGGLHLYVWDAAGKRVIYAHSGYEYNRGDLSDCIEALRAGEDPIDAGWEGAEDDPQAAYDAWTYPPNGGWQIVADQHGTYPKVMGAAARLEFGVSDDAD